ncbi:GumC family protein [Methylobacterium komagatae]
MSRIRMRNAAPAFPAAPRPEGVSVAQVLRNSVSWIVIPTAAAAIGAGIFVSVVPPTYTGETKLAFENRSGTGEILDGPAVAGQMQALMSRDIAREAVRRLKLVGNPEFDATAGEVGPVRQALMLLGIGGNPFDRTAEDRAIESYFDHLDVAQADQSRTVAIAFRSKDAALAAEAANTAAQLYLASLEAEKVDTAKQASSWLGGNIKSLRRKVAEAEAKVEAFRAKHGLVGSAGVTGQPLTAQQLSELSSQLTQARVLRADIAGRVAAIKDLLKDGRAYEITDVANNEMLRRTIETRITVRAQLALESRSLLPGHPRIKDLKAQLADLNAQIKGAAERAVRILENDATIADARVTSLQAAVDGQQNVVVKGNASEIELRALERDAKVQREQLEAYQTRYRETSAREAEIAAPADARIVSRAVTPTLPSFPQKLPIVGLATLLALLVSLGGVLARGLRHRIGHGTAALAKARIEPHAQEAGETFQPVVAANPFMLPEASLDRDAAKETAETPVAEPVMEGPAGPVAEAASEPTPQGEPTVAEATSLTTEPVSPRGPLSAVAQSAFDLAPLLERLSNRPVIAGAPQGRMVVLMETEEAGPDALPDALAAAFGRSGSVLVVDLLSKQADETGPCGFTDVVCGDADFVEAIQAEGPGGAHHVAAGMASSDVLFEEPRALAFTLEAMAEAYDWVICHLHPQAEAAEILGLVATLADSVVIASNADPADEALADLYATATQAGAGQVLIAQDRPTDEAPVTIEAPSNVYEFRRRAA